MRLEELEKRGESATPVEEAECRELLVKKASYHYQNDPLFKKRVDIGFAAERAIKDLNMSELIGSSEDATFIASAFFKVGLMVGRRPEEKKRFYFGDKSN